MNALAIDLGTTAAKVSVVAEDGRILGSGTEVVPTRFGPNSVAEQDAEQIWIAVLSAARQALSAAGPAAARDVAVVCATSQWSSIIPVDSSGKPVGPMFVWLDGRGKRYTSALSAGASSVTGQAAADGGTSARARWADVHGLYPSTSLAHLLHVQHDQPEMHARTAAYLEPMDYLNARFCGRLFSLSSS